MCSNFFNNFLISNWNDRLKDNEHDDGDIVGGWDTTWIQINHWKEFVVIGKWKQPIYGSYEEKFHVPKLIITYSKNITWSFIYLT